MWKKRVLSHLGNGSPKTPLHLHMKSRVRGAGTHVPEQAGSSARYTSICVCHVGTSVFSVCRYGLDVYIPEHKLIVYMYTTCADLSQACTCPEHPKICPSTHVCIQHVKVSTGGHVSHMRVYVMATCVLIFMW